MVNKHYEVITWMSGREKSVTKIAQSFLDNDEEYNIDINNFLRDVSSGKCHFEGRDGACNWTWASYTRRSLDIILQDLKPFFHELWTTKMKYSTILSQHEAIIGIDQDEMANHAIFYVMTFNPNKDKIYINSWKNNQIRWIYESLMSTPKIADPNNIDYYKTGDSVIIDFNDEDDDNENKG